MRHLHNQEFKLSEFSHDEEYHLIGTTAALIIGAAMVVSAGATAYSAKAQSTAAKKAAGAQEAVGMAALQAPLDAEKAAAETAKANLKLRQASKTDTILTSPLGAADPSTNTKALLGV